MQNPHLQSDFPAHALRKRLRKSFVITELCIVHKNIAYISCKNNRTSKISCFSTQKLDFPSGNRFDIISVETIVM